MRIWLVRNLCLKAHRRSESSSVDLQEGRKRRKGAEINDSATDLENKACSPEGFSENENDIANMRIRQHQPLPSHSRLSRKTLSIFSCHFSSVSACQLRINQSINQPTGQRPWRPTLYDPPRFAQILSSRSYMANGLAPD